MLIQQSQNPLAFKKLITKALMCVLVTLLAMISRIWTLHLDWNYAPAFHSMTIGWHQHWTVYQELSTLDLPAYLHRPYIYTAILHCLMSTERQWGLTVKTGCLIQVPTFDSNFGSCKHSDDSTVLLTRTWHSVGKPLGGFGGVCSCSPAAFSVT